MVEERYTSRRCARVASTARATSTAIAGPGSRAAVNLVVPEQVLSARGRRCLEPLAPRICSERRRRQAFLPNAGEKSIGS